MTCTFNGTIKTGKQKPGGSELKMGIPEGEQDSGQDLDVVQEVEGVAMQSPVPTTGCLNLRMQVQGTNRMRMKMRKPVAKWFQKMS